ncbi:MAG: Crp/Fnr family transcriptional regulator [Armatimonadetes bacterium]|nr:Crp/Fnr family transcriptional regulator [Armatimonadota bacterium]
MSSPADVRELLMRSPVAGCLAPGGWDVLLPHCERRSYRRGEVLWSAGDPAEFFVLLTAGVLRLSQPTPSGRHIVAELLGAGEVSGLLATVGRTGHPFTATALVDVEAVRVPSALWSSLAVDRTQSIQEAVSRILSAFGFLAQMATSDVACRLALVLLRLRELTPASETGETWLPVTRQILADTVATTVETTIRLLCRWEDEGIVVSHHGKVCVREPGLLLEAANGKQARSPT